MTRLEATIQLVFTSTSTSSGAGNTKYRRFQLRAPSPPTAANLMCSNDGGGDDGDDECHTAVEWGWRHVETL